MEERVQGFVIGSSIGARGEPVWKVRVNDAASPHCGQKFPVASVRDNIALARGLNVTFLIGTMDDGQGQQAMRAVDVQLRS